MDLNNKFKSQNHIRYEVDSDSGKRIFIIPNKSGIPDMKNVLCLTDTSLEIWEMIVSDHTGEQIICSLSKRYHMTENELEGDVTEFLNNLLEKGYISVIE